MNPTTLRRLYPVAGLACAALLLASCGSDNNASASGSDAAAAASGSSDCVSGTLNGEGSSAQKNAIDQVIANYIAGCPDTTVNYNPTGSGAGISQFIAGQVDWAGSDSALKDKPKDGVVETQAAAKRCDNNPAWNIPMVVGPIAIAYNLPGVDSLTLTPEVTAKIFDGTVKTWDDPAIAAVNTGAKLPSTPIKVFFRSDESGTTENFTKYLSAAAGMVWTDEPSKTWPGSGEGREKSAGVSEGVKGTAGGITYVEWSYAKDNNLGVAKVDNGAGAVELTGDSVGKAVDAAKRAGEGNDLKLELDYATKVPGAYPVLLVTYEIVCSKGGIDADKTKLLKNFLTFFASQEQQDKLEDIGYAPLPSRLESDVDTSIQAIS